MLARGIDLLTSAREQGRAVPAFTVYSLEGLRAVCIAAERVGLPAIISAGSSSSGAVGREPLAAAALKTAEHANVPVGIHLDHSTDPEEIATCVALGYTSVMIDGSALPFEDNVALTLSVTEYAHGHAVWVEGELGTIAGHEDASADVASGELTDPDQAAEFVARTGIDALAAAVGTVHGFTTRPQHVNLERVHAIASAIPVPLVLHGASGLGTGELAATVAAGVAKVNINAELRRAYLGALEAGLALASDDDILRVQRLAIDDMTTLAAAKLLALIADPERHSRDTPGGEADGHSAG